MQVQILSTAPEAGRAAAISAAARLHQTLQTSGAARIVLATGASQFDFLAELVAAPGIYWSRVTMFHLDEYLDLPADHPASFRRYLRERFIDRVHPGQAILIDGQADPQDECRRLGA